MSALGGERSAVQRPLLRYAQEAGWQHIPPEEALRQRGGESGAILREVLVGQLQRLNPGVVDRPRAEKVARRLGAVRPTIEGNLEVWEHLKGLKTVFVEAERRERNVRLLDPDHPEANCFHVTEEFSFRHGTGRAIRPDLVFLVNGIPVLLVETKAASRLEGIAEALDQVRRYHQQQPELLAVLQLHALTHLVQLYYGATWSLSRKALYNWREELGGPGHADFESLVKSFVAPRRVLRVLSDFILFTRLFTGKDQELAKVVLRPHQMRAAERVLARARDARKRRGLIWHTQGSGKTYTMIVVAKRLIEEPAFGNPTVLLLVDRNELEAQLFGNLESVGFASAVVADSRAHLRQLLAADRRGLIVSTIHKFDGMPADVSRRANVFVLVDEAHRSTGGDLGNYLMGALPNATYVGFTGTPIDQTAHGRGTFKVFGRDDERGYLDKYSIRESIQDGTTVPLHYSLAPNSLLVDRETLEREFLSLAELEGVSDPEELNRVLERAVTLRSLLKNPERVEKVAAFVAKHFRENVEPMGYKGFVVGVDREACALYKAALDRHLPDSYSEVVISHGYNDGPELAKFHYSEEREQAIRSAFRKPDELPKLLIVTEKLLTGFDAPILYCMYLDKPMRDHVLLQAIARVNRPYEDDQGRRKPAGFVLDFVGIFEKLERALAFDSQDVEGVVAGLDVLKEQFAAQMARARSEYLPVCQGLSGDRAAEAVLEHFRDREARESFYGFFRELGELYEIISPDECLRPFLGDYDALARVYRLVRAAYEPHVAVDRSFLRKTAELVQRSTHTPSLAEPRRIYKLDEAALSRLVAEEKPETVKVFDLVKALYDLVEQQGGQAPYLLSIGERAEQVAAAFKERQITTQEALQQLTALVEEYREAERARQGQDLSPEAFAVYWLLTREGAQDATAAAREVGRAFDQHPHWQRSREQERQVRVALMREIRKVLVSATVEQVVGLAERVLAMLRRAAA